MSKHYRLINKDGHAKRGEFTTIHGIIQTPVFMNVGTAAAIKGAVSTMDLQQIKTQVELSNTYHLHVRPGDEVVKKMGGLHRFMVWDKPILTDSGGFQVFSLAGLRKIKEEGVYFNSHVDGRKIFMGPEQSMQIQSNLASTIAMAFDECIPNPSTREYVRNSVERTTRWLARCKAEMARLNSLEDTINRHQMLFGINQGGTYDDIRAEHAEIISEFDLDGYAIGGLAVGESHEEMYRIIEAVTVPRKGAEVARMTEKDMEDVLQIRRALDELAVGLACVNMAEVGLKKIYVALKNFEKKAMDGDVKEVAQADVEFHDAIYQASNNPKLVNMLNNLRGQMFRYRVEYLKDRSIYPRLIGEHAKIYAGLKCQDRDTVVEIVRYHVMNQEIVIKNMIQEMG